MSDVDVLIAGAGPSGAALAARMAELGHGVLLCERSEFPRPKLCGEFLSPEVLRYLERLGFGERFSIDAPVIRRVALASARSAPATHTLPETARGLSREVLDSMLVELARARGATWRPRCRVIGIERVDGTCSLGPHGRDDAGFRVTSLVGGVRRIDRARAVIDARGRTRGGRRGQESFIGLQRHYRPRSWACQELADTVRLHVFAGGYLGLAPVEGGLVNLCLLARTRDLRQAGGRPETLVGALAARDRALGRLLADMEPVHPRFTATTGISFGVALPGAHALAIGDAAGAITPIAGDGIAMALRSAEIASVVLDRFLCGATEWESARREMRQRWRTEFRTRLLTAALVHRAATSAWSQRALMSVLRRSPRLLQTLYRGTRETRPARGPDRPGGTGASISARSGPRPDRRARRP